MTIEQLKISVIEKEINFAFSKSGGKGGQHVNKTESKVELYFNIDRSAILTESAKIRIKSNLKNRINLRGELVLYDETSRSQHLNRANVLEKFYELISSALKVQKKRKKTKPSKSSLIKKKENKKIHSNKKKLRRQNF
jgi:ribosome-associated protein